MVPSLMLWTALVFQALRCGNVKATITEDFKHVGSNLVDFTLIGANGDLAKKYLWKGLFHLYREYHVQKDNEWTFGLYGAGTTGLTTGVEQLNSTFLNAVSCKGDNLCAQTKARFRRQLSYVQLKEISDYQRHCAALDNASLNLFHCYKDHPCTYQRIFYLSVPPFAYETISKYIAENCRPQEGTGSLKIIFEKPFGHNQPSANILASVTSEYFAEEEIYRVDHYLGKQAVEQIIQFRKDNKLIEELLNNDHVDKVEIVMKETAGLEGRTKFYDKYGVLCDVMQNHLSEILYLLTMELPITQKNVSQSDLLSQSKVQLLQQIQPLESKDCVLGQYKDYLREVRREFSSVNKTTNKPTFAGVTLKIASTRWGGTPMLLVAGKAMDERVGYARVIFKDNSFVVAKSECPSQQQIIFHIGHGSIASSAIFVSKGLPLDDNYIPHGWSRTDRFDHLTYMQSKVTCYNVFEPIDKKDAYTFLIEQMFLGHKEFFLTTPALLDSWRVWGPLVDSDHSQSLCIYSSGGVSDGELDFTFDREGMKFTHCLTENTEIIVKQTEWLNQKAVTGDEESLFKSLFKDLLRVAYETVYKGRDFHLALSGGSSPTKLFKLLTTFKHLLPWKRIHIWQVDERCTVEPTLSNFNNLCELLLDNIPSLRYQNIHPMPIKTSTNHLCLKESALLYEKTVKSQLGEQPKFDYIVLGVGADGHTASLFPHHATLDETERLVAISEDVPVEGSTRRITLTYPTLNLAKNIAVLAVGSKKCEILQHLHKTQCADESILKFYPICGVSPLEGELTWYRLGECEL